MSKSNNSGSASLLSRWSLAFFKKNYKKVFVPEESAEDGSVNKSGEYFEFNQKSARRSLLLQPLALDV